MGISKKQWRRSKKLQRRSKKGGVQTREEIRAERAEARRAAVAQAEKWAAAERAAEQRARQELALHQALAKADAVNNAARAEIDKFDTTSRYTSEGSLFTDALPSARKLRGDLSAPVPLFAQVKQPATAAVSATQLPLPTDEAVRKKAAEQRDTFLRAAHAHARHVNRRELLSGALAAPPQLDPLFGREVERAVDPLSGRSSGGEGRPR